MVDAVSNVTKRSRTQKKQAVKSSVKPAQSVQSKPQILDCSTLQTHEQPGKQSEIQVL